MSIDLYSSAKLTPPKLEAVGWDWESGSKSELQLEAIAESELKSEAIAESEPDWKRARLQSEAKAESELQSEWEVKDIDDVEESEMSSISTFGLDSDPEWEGFHRSELEPEVESKNNDDVELSELSSMYDNNPLPIAFRNKHFFYKNQAMIDIEKAYDEYLEQGRKLGTGPWDAIAPPHNLRLVGGVRPYDITDEERPRFIHYCNLSLNKYNAENQGANFVFYELVKATSLVSCRLYYITFMAKDASNNNNTDASTFQAKVSDKVVPKGLETEIILCLKKPN